MSLDLPQSPHVSCSCFQPQLLVDFSGEASPGGVSLLFGDALTVSARPEPLAFASFEFY